MKAVSYFLTATAVTYLYSLPVASCHAARATTNASVNLVSGPNSDSTEEDGGVVTSQASGNGGSATATASTNLLSGGGLAVAVSSTNSVLTNPASASAGFNSGVRVVGLSEGETLPATFNFELTGSVSSFSSPGSSGSVSSAGMSFSVQTLQSATSGSARLTTQAGLPLISVITNNISGNVTSRIRPRFTVETDLGEIVSPPLSDLQFRDFATEACSNLPNSQKLTDEQKTALKAALLRFEHSQRFEAEEFEAGVLEGVVASLATMVTEFGLSTLDIAPGVNVKAGTDVTFVVDGMVNVPLTFTPGTSDILTIRLVTNASSTPDAASLSDFGGTLLLDSVTVPANYLGSLEGVMMDIDGTGLIPVTLAPEPSGDFDGNGVLTTFDIDLLMNEVAAGTDDIAFDLNSDGSVDDGDRDEWLTQAATERGFAESLLVGDSNLDGAVDSIDLNALALNWRGETEVNDWTRGNFTGAAVNSIDLNALALNWRQTASAPVASQAVPEPRCLALLGVAGLVLAACRRPTS